MKFPSKAPFKSVAAAAATLMVLAFPAQADDRYTMCASTCLQAASQAQSSAEAGAAPQVQASCSQNTSTWWDYQSCVNAAQPAIRNAGQVAYNSAYSSCFSSCYSGH